MSNLLSVQQLDIAFGKHQVLHQVSFDVAAGHIVALVGPNGAGKSTIMKAVLGLISIDHGHLTIDSHPVSMTSHQALKQVGALIEYPGIYPFLTGRQHLELFADKENREANIEQVIKALHMTDYIDHKAKLYSLGMKQKLGIAQALVDRPKLVILDEPMNGLDPEAVKQLRDYIRQLASEGTSFLISSHILSELEKLADDVLFLDQGHIIQQTSMAELVTSGGTSYHITTADDTDAKSRLIALGLPVLTDDTDPEKLILLQKNPQTLNQALHALLTANIEIVDIVKVQHDLEESFLDMVNHQQEVK